ncbi:MAG: hypothetical protein RTU30_02895 [Candidatus Thorarchaeota archaeon]
MDEEQFVAEGEEVKGDEKMKDAYEASSKLLRMRLSKDRPEDLEVLERVKESDVIVVEGGYDHAQVNFEMAGIPHTVISEMSVGRTEFNRDQLLFINCPGSLDMDGIEKVEVFVRTGGMLVTTDWALENVLEKAFPGFVARGGTDTADDVVRVEIHEGGEDSFIASVIDKTDDPQWWLEGSSYPIKILDKKKVKIFVSSKEMKKRYGEAPIIVSFRYGDGEVIHMTSHFYLQRTETRTERHQGSAAAYAAEKGVSKEEAAALFDSSDLSTAEVESAYTSQAFMTDMVARQRKRAEKREEEEEP